MLGAEGNAYNKHTLEKLPVIEIPALQQQPFITLVDQILSAKATDPDADTSNLEMRVLLWRRINEQATKRIHFLFS